MVGGGSPTTMLLSRDICRERLMKITTKLVLLVPRPSCTSLKDNVLTTVTLIPQTLSYKSVTTCYVEQAVSFGKFGPSWTRDVPLEKKRWATNISSTPLSIFLTVRNNCIKWPGGLAWTTLFAAYRRLLGMNRDRGTAKDVVGERCGPFRVTLLALVRRNWRKWLQLK